MKIWIKPVLWMMSYFFPPQHRHKLNTTQGHSVDRVQWLVLVLAFLKESHVAKEPVKEKYFKGTPMVVSNRKTFFRHKSHEIAHLRLPRTLAQFLGVPVNGRKKWEGIKTAVIENQGGQKAPDPSQPSILLAPINQYRKFGLSVFTSLPSFDCSAFLFFFFFSFYLREKGGMLDFFAPA